VINEMSVKWDVLFC